MKRIVFPLLILSSILGACQLTQTQQQHRWFLASKNFSQRNESMVLSVSSAQFTGNKVSLFVHVTDTSHHFYRGISPSAFCNVSVWKDFSQSHQIQNIQVTEVRNQERKPMAVTFVLDYSGSMDFRKKKLYDITHQFIDEKREQDAYAILRYGDYSSLDVPLTQDKSILKSEFQPSPKKQTGTSTATWDAIAEAVNTFQNCAYEEKVMIVLTDGQENASKITQSWAYWKAKTAGVKIMAISLGTEGEKNMKGLCEKTGGMYTSINNLNKLQFAYTDFQNKQSSYYKIEFETPIIGKQNLRVNLCNNINLRASYVFDNSPANVEPVRLKSDTIKAQIPVTSTTRTDTPLATASASNTSRDTLNATPSPQPTATDIQNTQTVQTANTIISIIKDVFVAPTNSTVRTPSTGQNGSGSGRVSSSNSSGIRQPSNNTPPIGSGNPRVVTGIR